MNLKTKMEKIINSSYSNMEAIIVQKRGKIVYENYFNQCTANTTFHIFSVTKSIISILIGIAIDKGVIQSMDQKILDFFPEYTVKRGEKLIQQITIRDLMTMTAPYKYKSEPYTEYFSSDSWVKASLDLLGGKGKIGEFRYAPIIGPDILSGVLVKVTGESVLDFARGSLFSPLGITVASHVNFKNKEEQLAFYEAKNVKGWVAAPDGINSAGWGLNLTASELVRIGQLYLEEGIWKGKQIVSSKWIQESTKEHSRWGKYGYGYLWWIIDNAAHVYAAIGDGGNVIYVNAKKEIVISIASLYVPYVKDPIKLIQEYIEPVFEE